MKKIIALVISMMMLLLAVGCGGGEEQSKKDGDKITMGSLRLVQNLSGELLTLNL